MDKTKTKKQSPKAILAEVTKEMAKPRVAMSAREHSRIQERCLGRQHLHYLNFYITEQQKQVLQRTSKNSDTACR